RFASTEEEFRAAVAEIGVPCVVKPVMSSSGKGQSVIEVGGDVAAAWACAREGARVKAQAVIVEGFVEFAYEITMLTVRHAGGITTCPPVGHVQEDGDYRESWQPHPMSPVALARSIELATTVVQNLGGYGVFGVELFVTAADEVLFSEVSPRPHDTGMVTLISQPASEFALHVRAILGLPIRDDDVQVPLPSASAVVLGAGSGIPTYSGLEGALTVPTAQVRVFGKPTSHPGRRMAVAVAQGDSLDEARARARTAASLVQVNLTISAG
ncbi:MAG: purT, partial [Frankiales bacterium]|nr:purT [Frankiales bacterium]